MRTTLRSTSHSGLAVPRRRTVVVMVVVDRAGEARLRVVAVSGRRRSLGGAGEWRGSRRGTR